MKKFTLSLALAFMTLGLFAQTEAPSFDKIAIIPFELLGYPAADNVDAVQENIESAFDQLQVPAEIMTAEQTAAAFSAKGINKDNIHSNTVEDLASILGVDAIIIGEVNSPTNGKANMNQVVLQLVNGDNGQVVWRAEKDIAVVEEKADVNEVLTASAQKFPLSKNN